MQQRATTLPSNTKVAQPTEKAQPSPATTQEPVPSPEVAQKIAEEEAIAKNPEAAMALADQKIEQIKQETATTPEEKQKLDNAVAGMSLPQKLAMIAMAVAPTAVGFALAGKKGAYLGASATGKGLQEGAEMSFKEIKDQEDEKKYAKDVTNEYGQIFEVYRDGTSKPRVDPTTGDYMFAANEKRTVFDPQTGERVDTLKFKERPAGYPTRPGQTAQSQQTQQAPMEQAQKGTAKTTIAREIAEIESNRRRVGFEGTFTPTEISALVEQNPNMTEDDLTEEQRRRWIREKIKEKERIADEEARIAADKRQAAREQDRKKNVVDKTIVNQQLKNLNAYRDGTFKKDKEMIDRVDKWASMDGNTQSEGSALFFDYMKMAQADETAIREGDQRTIESYLNFSTRWSQIESVFRDGGKMSPELRADIQKFMAAVKRFKMAKLAITTNDFANQSYESGEATYKAFVSGISPEIKGPAVRYAQEQLAGKRPITEKELADGVRAGIVGNGTMYQLTNRPGEIFIHTGIVREPVFDPQTKTTQRVLKVVGTPTPWRVK
jgi:hypothetical protein